MGPASVVQEGLGSPCLSEFLFKGAEGQSKGVLVGQCELDVLYDENPEGGFCEAAGNCAVDVRADVDGSC